MEINNFEQIKSLLVFDDKGDWFYFLQILQRHKDNPEVKNLSNSRVIKTYYISTIDYLTLKEEEIKFLCGMYNARAYINLNPRSYERLAFHMLKEITDRILNKDYKSVSKAYDSTCGKFSVGDKKWIVDIDEEEIPFKLTMDIELCDPITYPIYNNEKHVFIGQSKIIATIPTKSGWHLITKPFNLKQFKDKYPEVDVQKNNPTVLYFNNKENE